MQAQNPMANLEKNYPQLTELYRDDLGKYSAHYIFAIDVSGTMNKYSDVVIPALKPFIQALPAGDRVTVIPYGTDAKSSMPGFLGVINPEFKQSLAKDIDRLYTSPNYTKDFKAYTNIYAAEEAIVNVIRSNRSDYPVVVIIQVGDFRNDVHGERKLTVAELHQLRSSYEGITNGLYTRVVALELPVDRNAPGYCLDQLRDEVFAEIGEAPNKGLEIVSMSTSQSAIRDWFDRLKNDIMTTKLRAIVAAENKQVYWVPEVSVDIDGKAKMKMAWIPTRLYPSASVATECDDKNYYFENYDWSRQYQANGEIHDKFKIGRIQHRHWGLHKYKDNLRFHIEQPTKYDDELAMLNMPKPSREVCVPVDRWVFTFILPFWLTAVIVSLIILYIWLVLKAAKRNLTEKFKGKVQVFDAVGRPVTDEMNINIKKNQFVIGDGGTNGLDVPGAEWSIRIVKESPSPLLFSQRPAFRWRSAKGYVSSGSKKNGLIGRYGGKMKKGFDLTCGPSVDVQTHTVAIRISKNN